MSPQEDIDRIGEVQGEGESHKTMIWLPSSSTKTQTELGQLVIIDHLLERK
ncbi:MAG: hypothetical protein R3C11_24805 [Planctomycetaceae bacterium]